jgi:hypothetical protein
LETTEGSDKMTAPYLHGVHPVVYHNNKEEVLFTVTTTIMYYIFYLITLLHVSVPKDHHQVDPQSTKVVIIFFTNMDPYRCTYIFSL